MNLLLTGRNGQVGSELQKILQPALATDHAALDLADADAIRRLVREVKPDVIVNAAAYTAVDKAESEPELAMQVNAVAPGVLAGAAVAAVVGVAVGCGVGLGVGFGVGRGVGFGVGLGVGIFVGDGIIVTLGEGMTVPVS